jgi:hypothetical protein
MATNRSHCHILRGKMNSYFRKMESRRQALLRKYKIAYDHYKTNQGEINSEYEHADMTDWIIYEMLDTPYFTISECLDYIRGVINDELEMRIKDMFAFITVAKERQTLTSQDYNSILQCFLQG